MMHHLDMDDIRLIDEVLSQHLRGLLAEIAHADDRAYRDELRARSDKIEALRNRLIDAKPDTTAGQFEISSRRGTDA